MWSYLQIIDFKNRFVTKERCIIFQLLGVENPARLSACSLRCLFQWLASVGSDSVLLIFPLYLEERICIQGPGPRFLTHASRLIFMLLKHRIISVKSVRLFAWVRLWDGEGPSQYILSVVTVLFQGSKLLSQCQWSLLSCKPAFEYV